MTIFPGVLATIETVIDVGEVGDMPAPWASVVAVTVLLAGEFPTPFTARTRKLYAVDAVSPVTVTVVVEAPDLDTVVQATGHLVAVESLY